MDGYIVGTCEDMCPEPERKLRTKERMLHFFEYPAFQPAENDKIIKCFARSAAGVRLPNSSEIRTYKTLLKTISYLMNHILIDNRKPYYFVFNYIFDRLRAIRQEMVMQNLCAIKTISILEPITMFLAYSSYRLCQEQPKNYESKINHQHLQECLKKLLCCYDLVSTSDNSSIIDRLNRVYIESIYLLFNMGKAESLSRAVCIKHQLNHVIFDTSVNISINFWQQNYQRCFRDYKRLPPILAAIFSLRLQEMRRHILLTFSHAYNSKLLTVPVDSLKTILNYSNRRQVIEACQFYNLTVVDNTEVKFEKLKFNITKPIMQSESEDCVEIKFKNTNLTKLILMNILSDCLDKN